MKGFSEVLVDLGVKMTTPGVADWPSPGKQLGDVTGRRINLRKGARYQFSSQRGQAHDKPPACSKKLIS